MKRNALTDLCLKRPVTTAMIFTVLLSLGIGSLLRIPLETYPDLTYPRLSISARWSGASPEALEAFVTSRLEAEASTLSGIEEVSSRSQTSNATIDLEFARGTDMDFVQLDLHEKIARVREDLPEQVVVSVRPYVPQEVAQDNLLQYTFTGPYGVNRLQRWGEDLIRRKLMTVEGIAEVSVLGGERRQLKVLLDKEKVEALGLDQGEVSSNLRAMQNLVETVGTVRQGDYQFNVVVREELKDLDTFKNAIVARRGNRYIRLSEIGRVVDGYAEPQGYQRLNGQDRVAVYVNAVAGSNIIDVADRAKQKIEEIRAELPPGTRLIENRDNSEDIRRDLETLELRSVVILLLIFVVLLLFLKGIANPFIILSSIATSVLLTVGIFYFLGGSLNMMSLAGLAMGFGMMVDNSIVVLDNIHRHRERGSGRLSAASIGTSEMILPILAGTGTTIIVFLPFLYLQGDLQQVYVPFALAVTTSLACSLLVSFTLIPSLAARVLQKSATAAGEGPEDPWELGALEREAEEGQSRGGELGAEHVLGVGDNVYQRLLRWMLGHKAIVVTCVLIVGFLSYRGFDKYVTKGRIWRYGTQTETLNISVRAPTGSDLKVMSTLIGQIEDRLRPLYDTGQVESFETSVSPTSGYIVIYFPEEIIRQGLPYLVKDQLSVFAGMMGGVVVSISGFGDYFSAGGISSESYSNRITILGYNYLKVKELAEDLAARLTRNPRIRDVNTNYGYSYGGSEKQIVLRFDRDRLADYGLTTQAVMMPVNSYIASYGGGGQISFGGEEVDYAVKIEGFTSRDIVDLMNLVIRIPGGGEVRLDDLSYMETERVLPAIQRKDQQYSRTIGYEFRGPYKMGQKVQDDTKATMILPNGYEFDEQEIYWQSEEEKKQLTLIILFAIALVYMLTASLYESFFHPLTVILTVPLAMIGVFAGYFFFDKGFDQSAYVGVILMGGIVVNNSIILVDHINHLRTFMKRRDAVVRAARERARPILMTTITTVIGLAPLVIGAHEGQDMWYTLAFTIVCALPVATFFTLTIIPLVYELMDTLQVRVRRGIGGLVAALGEKQA